MENTFIVVSMWCERDKDGDAIEETMRDEWEHYPRYKDALGKYEQLLKTDAVYGVPAICVVVKSELPWYSEDSGFLDYVLTNK